MKTFFSYSFLVVALFQVLAQGQTAPVVGYTTYALPANTLQPVGLTLHPSTVAAGSIDSVVGTVLTDAQLAFTPVANRLYILEIISGTLAGTIQEIPSASISPTTITTMQNLQTGGLAAGTSYKLRLAPTLEEIFGTTATSALSRGVNSGNADIIWVPTDTGAYTKYFIHSTSSAIRLAGTTTPAPNVPVVYADGILIQKRGTAGFLVITGEVKTGGSTSLVRPGIIPISLVAPVGLTLNTAGFNDDVAKGVNAGNADIIWVPSGPNAYNKYYYHTSNNWRNVAAPTINIASDPILTGAVLIERKSPTPMNLDLNVPSYFPNAGGSTSSTGPVSLEITASGVNLVFTMKPTVLGKSYQLQCSDTIQNGTWQDIGSSATGNGSTLVITIPYNANVPQRFFRLKPDSNVIPHNFALIPAGPFTMGRTSGDFYLGALPKTRFSIYAFKVGLISQGFSSFLGRTAVVFWINHDFRSPQTAYFVAIGRLKWHI